MTRKITPNKCRNACCTFTGFPRDIQLNTTDEPSTTVGGQLIECLFE